MALMRRGLLVAALFVLLGASPALAQQGWDQNLSEQSSKDKAASIAKEPYARAMQLKQKGQYSEAMPILEQIAKQGHGYEIVQLELGKCYYDLAGQKAGTPDVFKLKTQGFAWILAAAGDGLGTAEEELVRIYLDGNGVPTDKVEAAKWYFLWRRNPSRMQIGNAQFDAGLESRLKSSLRSAQWQDAQKRADEWRPL